MLPIIQEFFNMKLCPQPLQTVKFTLKLYHAISHQIYKFRWRRQLQTHFPLYKSIMIKCIIFYYKKYNIVEVIISYGNRIKVRNLVLFTHLFKMVYAKTVPSFFNNASDHLPQPERLAAIVKWQFLSYTCNYLPPKQNIFKSII